MNIIRNSYLLILIFSSLLFFWRSPLTMAAEKVSFRYGLLEFSIPVDSLETYAKTGKIDRHLDTYIQSASPQELAELQQILTYKVDIDRVTVYRFFNSFFGKTILNYLGEIIQISPTQNGFYGLRSALILATGESEGLNVLNILRNFPTETIHINGKTSLKLASTFVELIEQTNETIAAVQHQSNLETTSEPKIDFTQQPNIRKSGAFTWEQETLNFHDRKRNRSFTADLYRPKVNTYIPVIVISPGLGADSNNYDYLAQHLASYGFAVAVVNHPGSDRQRIEDFFRGINREIVEAQEFIDRPRDISYLLDELQQQQLTNPATNSHLNLEQVGIIGHSFGGYTALALAGAKLNIEHLQTYCQSDAIDYDSFNFSLLLQCLAAELSTTKNYQLSDSRIQAIFTLNPINSSIFGQQGLSKITLPITFVAGSSDIIAPALLEQIKPFTWLESPHKYLLLIEKGHHVYNNSKTFDLIANEPKNNTFYLKLSREYLKAMSLAFMQTYIAKRNNYPIFLNSSYAQFLSQDFLKINLVEFLNKTNFKMLE
ncbi:alpha/beta hydrolase [Hyella patelloides]|nr:alpha/beta hydrolase [Hyella patelloides]